MATGKNTIVVYRDWKSIFDKLTDEEAGRLIKHFFSYVNDEDKDPCDRLTELLFEPIKQTLKRDLQKWVKFVEKQSENGKKGGRPNNPEVELETQLTQALIEEPKKADSVSESVSDSDKLNKRTFQVPTLLEIQTYCKERQNTVDASKFFNFYESKGWMVGKNKMKNWKAAIHTWEKEDKPTQPIVKRKLVMYDTDGKAYTDNNGQKQYL